MPGTAIIYTPSVIGMISFVEENGGQHYQGVPIEALATCVTPTTKQTYFRFKFQPYKTSNPFRSHFLSLI